MQESTERETEGEAPSSDRWVCRLRLRNYDVNRAMSSLLTEAPCQSSADRSRSCMARRRKRARDLGLCGQCCRGSPARGRSICADCHTANDARKRARRKRSLHPLVFHDGANAMETFGHVSVEPPTSPARQLLATASNLSTSGHPRFANEVLDSAYQVAVQMRDFESAAEALEGLCRQAWANAETPQCVRYSRLLLDLPLSRTSALRIRGFLRLARTEGARPANRGPRGAIGRRESMRLHAPRSVCDVPRMSCLR